MVLKEREMVQEGRYYKKNWVAGLKMSGRRVSVHKWDPPTEPTLRDTTRPSLEWGEGFCFNIIALLTCIHRLGLRASTI